MKKFIVFTVFILSVAIGVIIFTNQKQSKDQVREKYNVTFDKELLHSNLYSPTDIKPGSVTDSSIEIKWTFQDKDLVVPSGMAKEYAIISGFRIYRDGYWLTDVPRTQFTIIDTGLYPNDSYTYAVSAITFDNKIEGQKSSSKTIRTREGNRNSILFPVKKPVRYLALGDSISEGQKAASGNGWVDQVGLLLKKENPNTKIFNRSLSGSFVSTVADTAAAHMQNTSPDFVTIAVGLNDLIAASRDIGNVSMTDYKKNLKKIINEINPMKRSVLLLNIYFFECCYREADNTDKRLVWNKLIRDIANEHSIYMVDASTAMETAGGKRLLGDALHPNQNGHNIIAREVIKALRTNR